MNIKPSILALLVVLAGPSHAAESGGGGECSSSTAEGSDYGSYILGMEGGAAAWTATNPSSTATGAYQFLFGTLQDMGYISSSSSKPPNGAGDWSGTIWTGQDGVWSREQFMASQAAQNAALERFTQQNLGAISGSWTPGQVVNGIPLTAGGVAAATHMLGAGGFNQWAASGFSPSGLDASIAAAHGWTPEQYNQHLMGRVAGGGCFDPGDIQPGEEGVGELPEVFLMPWQARPTSAVMMPGQWRSGAR